uniref:BTG anti-proliferation factor 2 n=1 Tax=Cyanistes caeruleus TaxID=156563 RepID=A0A8C0VBV4_CYACU
PSPAPPLGGGFGSHLLATQLSGWFNSCSALLGFGVWPLNPKFEHYKHHWFPEKPFKGSGYRCIRINHRMDPIISKAASQIGLSLPQLYQLLPSELTLWVDPYEVSYRIGEDGSICVLYEAAKPPSSYGGMLTCKNQMMLGRTSPSKNYIMTVSS